jgi:hypothetical protein
VGNVSRRQRQAAIAEYEAAANRTTSIPEQHHPVTKLPVSALHEKKIRDRVDLASARSSSG